MSESEGTMSIRKQAADWVAALEQPEKVEALWPKFTAWLEADPRHRPMYLQVERCWHQATVLLKERFHSDPHFLQDLLPADLRLL